MDPSSLPASAFEGLGLPARTIKILTTGQKPSPADAASPNVLHAQPQSAQELNMGQSSITLYAELLLHIRTVTLFASLRSLHTRETKATLSADGCEITITHENEQAKIRLPIKVKEAGGDAALYLPANPPSKELTLRLQIEEEEGTELLGPAQIEGRKENIAPWGGVSLTLLSKKLDGIEIVCKSCESVLVCKGSVKEWRDLPNENWAEMMDFWHCHKPDEHHLHDHTHEEIVGKKGYAAGNKLEAVVGVGFVDIMSLLLKEENCEGVKTSEHDRVVCRSCSAPLGHPDHSASGFRLWKWALSIPSSKPSTYDIQKWISARLLFLVENTGARKFHVHPPMESAIGYSDGVDSPSAVPSLLLWLFTPDLLFSSSFPSTTRHDPTRAMKIFYQAQTFEPLKPGEPEVASVEEVELPVEVFEALKTALEESKTLLPAGARKFKGWDVGVLERFDVGEGKVED